ncbi:cellulase family glycosylhydrolase [Bradyrhizobium sp. CER78]|uniref:glycoside hydrolase family 5 protein n=1 Tax=Bradyrhizobium sp. CER78 TaxID=3039162 RepID=UPI0024475435|nr:cellulase family glycosylhydrolase [Bradyrhizobium sp. CER78]MDH2380853.1 cellulase family glycosylhydrolase [Bradyrhizobium sp. CER78]
MTSRRSILRNIAGVAMLSPFAALRAVADPVSPLPNFRRGIGVAHAFGWADVHADGAYVDPPFSAPRFQFTAEQRQAIRAAGFDFVRLVVDVGPFLAFDGASRDRLDDLIVTAVRALLAADLGVIVDMHPSAMNPAYRPAELTAGVNTPKFQAVLALLARLAGRLGQVIAEQGNTASPRIALELMNEPEIPAAEWQPMLEAAYAAARSGSATLPLVLGGGGMNAPGALAQIDMAPFAGDARLIFTYHDYSPWQFTHQGVLGSPAYALDAIVYPAPASVDAMNKATDQRVTALGLTGAQLDLAQQAKQTLASYVGSGFNRSTLERTFQQVAAWRTAHNLPAHAILLGEFGVHKTPYPDSDEGEAARARWLRDMHELAETYGFAWSCWTYLATGGFALAENEAGPGFDAATCAALGLASPRAPE